MNDAKKLLIETLSKWQRDIKMLEPQAPIMFKIHSKILNDKSKVDEILVKFEAIKGPCIYRILIPDTKYCPIIRRSFETFQFTNKPLEKGVKRHVSRLMEKESKCIYVGSKRADIKARIKQHLGYGNARTYSLDLKFWFPPKIKILIEVYSVSLDNELLVALEQSMWANSKPMFGKQSGL